MRYAALATRNTEFYADRAFSLEGIASMRPSLRNMAEPWMPVHAEARARGIRLLTADRVEAEGIDPRRVLLIAYDWNPDAQRLFRQGARPTVLVSFEPPVIAWQLYYNLPRISRRFPHVFLFEGARDRVHPSARFHPLIFPQPCPPPRPTGKAWGKRRFLIMVNSNKALAHPLDLARWFDRPREVSFKRELAALRYRPIARVRYMTRLRAIQAFAARDDFDLYGEGWERRHPAVPDDVHAAAQRAFRGPVDDKISLLAGYRFALAMENTRFPGYLSEKLFDCMYARCIPIYYGAPDVAQYVPPSSFIDARQFPTFAALDQFLRSITESEATRYLEAAHTFLTSPAFERFCADRFARDMVDALASVPEQ
jgi:hypothetical protein